MQCHHFDAGRCRSCSWLAVPHADQLVAKQQHVAGLVDTTWLPAAAGPEAGFRNKAKMVVAGPVDAPTLGILDPRGGGVDLRDCGLHTPGIAAALPVLAEHVTRAGLTPYDVPGRRGELKHLLVTESPAGGLLVRWVLRSQEPVARLRKHLPWLHERLPALVVASVNLQPEHKAVLEGEREIVLTEQVSLPMRVAGLDLHLRPQSFFQTNTAMAEVLYRQARAWADELAPSTVWDLYCGVGGFALHLAAPERTVTGVEVSVEAVASAQQTSAEQTRDATGLPGLAFVAADATGWALAQPAPPDLVVVNPPRRGLGPALSTWLEESGVGAVIYSSCNAESLARDLALMPSLRPVQGRLVDMFPQTSHYEVVVRLER
ncbi:23S rRNA (uracil(747)-C(5))-methyltransferase RlmC [Nocardioides sp. SYSU D00038]|uniref:23S rRNA (uracil(747)-C(5))-methyltransferase RlmC n=1 Tax=Nocardioides sp. SYSU D00038 TaxID=2812554 RepID=UPI001967B4E9|nr:23S rRNA (uracil(747)-C(5))-methyltransferase RlmC [Nocardioides sp. SYSU D00038]